MKDSEMSRSAQNFEDPAPNPEAVARGKRLEIAVRDAGGRAKIRRLSGVPESTILGYEKGGEIKLSNAIALAAATGVRLEWLATGEGPRARDEVHDPTPAQPTAPPERPRRLSDTVNLDQLMRAYRAAREAASSEQQLLEMTLMLYDLIAAREASSPSSTTNGDHVISQTVKTS